MRKILCLTLLFFLINPWNAIAQQPIQDVVPHYETMQLGRGTVNTFAWRPAGEMIAVGGSKGIWLYDPYFQFIDFLDAPDVLKLEWHRDNIHLISLQQDKTIKLWDTTTFTSTVLIDYKNDAKERSPSIIALSLTSYLSAYTVDPDHEYEFLAVGLSDGSMDMWTFDMMTGESIFFEGFYSYIESIPDTKITAIAWKPTASGYFAVASDQEHIIVWGHNIISHESIYVGNSSINALAWSIDSSRIASGNSEGEIFILDLATEEKTATLTGHTAEIHDLAWSPDGKWLASVSGHIFEGSELRLWDGITYQPISVFPGTAALHTLEWRPGELAQGSQVTIAGEDNIVRTFDVETGAVIAMLQGHSNAIESIAWSPDGAEIASASDDGIIRVWDTATGDAIAAFQGHTRGTNTVAWSPNGLMIASAGWDNTVRIWMRSTGKVRAVLTGHRDRVWMVAWSPDGKILASASRDATIRLWNPYTGELIKTLRGNNGEMSSVAWKSDGLQIAGSSDDGSVWLWDVATGEPLHTLQGHNHYVWSLAWQPGGDRLISGSWWDGTLRIWDTQAGERVGSLNSIQVLALSWSPGGSYLATSSADGVIRVWDYADGRVLQVLDSRAGKVYTVAWKPDGSQLASAGTDGIIRLWSE